MSSYGKKYHEQTSICYRDVMYGDNTVWNSGCGPASLCNALDWLGLGKYTVGQMCKYSESVGARVDGGTDMHKLLEHAASKYKFTYKTSNDNTELLQHLKNGGVAIMNNGTEYPLFSSGGHFVCAVRASGENVTVMDSYWYSGKYSRNAIRRNNIRMIEHGVVQTSIAQCGLATADRSPSYYLITKPKQPLKKSDTAPTFAVGKSYRTQTSLKLRTAAEKGQNARLRSELSAYTKTRCLSGRKEAVLRSGVKITAKRVATGKDGSVFIKSDSGWLLAWNSETKSVNIQ